MGEQGGGSRGRTRPKGSIETLDSGSLRVRVYAGIDALSGRDLYLKEVIPAGRDAWDRAEQVRDKLVQQVAEGRQPKTDATIAQMLGRYLAEWEGSARYLKTLRGYVRNHIDPVLGTIKAEGLQLDGCSGSVGPVGERHDASSERAGEQLPGVAGIVRWLPREQFLRAEDWLAPRHPTRIEPHEARLSIGAEVAIRPDGEIDPGPAWPSWIDQQAADPAVRVGCLSPSRPAAGRDP